MTDTRVLVTGDADARAVLWEEMRALCPSLPQPDWLDAGDAVEGAILLTDPGMAWDEFAADVARRAPIFIRHIAPASREVALRADEPDLETLKTAALELAPGLDSAQTFAVQSRILGEGRLPYRRVTVNESLSDALGTATGAVLDTRTPTQVLSVLCTPTVGYLGLSRTAQNRSAWPGGRHRFRREEGQVSRAEFKLLEALSVFGMELPAHGTALDMGAAPGGWTRVLRSRGLAVVAVDPADLDPRLMRDSGVRHVRRRIQDYLPQAPKFEVIVNDLKMDARASVALMLQAVGHLAPGGLAVMTLKLPALVQSAKGARATLGMIHADLRRLAEAYTIIGARQLYHNRSEITVVLRAP